MRLITYILLVILFGNGVFFWSLVRSFVAVGSICPADVHLPTAFNGRFAPFNL